MITEHEKIKIELKLKERTIIDYETKCWLHQGINKSKGYAFATINFKQVSVHRISAYLYLGFDLTDKTIQVNHKLSCPNLNCWNPEHIYIGTQQDNIQDLVILGKHSQASKFKTHCKHGHEFTEENTYHRKNGNRDCKTCMRQRDSERIRSNPHYKLD